MIVPLLWKLMIAVDELLAPTDELLALALIGFVSTPPTDPSIIICIFIYDTPGPEISAMAAV